MGMERETPRPGDYYRHFKNKLYEIVTVATHSETEEKYVVYHAMYGTCQDYIRPYDMFMSEVDHEKYPNVKQKYRFEKVGDRISGLTTSLTAGDSAAGEKKAGNRTAVPEELPSLSEKKRSAPVEPADKPDTVQSLDLLNAFLDDPDPEHRLTLLASRQDEITKRFVENVSLVLDLSIPEGELEEQLYHLKRYLRTMMRYDGSRLRS